MKLAERVSHFSESVIREMTRLANRHGAINLGQGMPDFEAPAEIKEAACQAIREGDEVELIRLRKDDYLQELRDEFNDMLKALEQRGAVAVKAPADGAVSECETAA